MAFENSILAGKKLVREAIQSPNYVTGVSGWTINKDGSAEFSNLTARGNITAESLSTGVAPNARVVIDSIPAGFPTVEFFTGDPSEVDEGVVGHTSFPFSAVMFLNSADIGDGSANLNLISPTGAVGAILEFTDTGSAFTPLVDFSTADMTVGGVANFTNTHIPTGLGDDDVPIILGDLTGPNLALSSQQIQARDNGGVQDLFIQSHGGGCSIVPLRHQSAFNNGGAGEDTASTSYVAMATATGITVENPASGYLTVAIDGSIQNSTAGASVRLSYQFRQDNAAGAIITAANDDWSAMSIQPNVRVGSAKIRTHAVTSPTGTIYVEMMKRCSAGTGTYQDCTLTVMPSP